VTDQTNQPDPTTSPTAGPTPDPPQGSPLPPATGASANPVSSGSPEAPSAAATAPIGAELGTTPSASASPGETPKGRRRWIEAAVVVGALVLIGGIGFAAGRTIDDNDGRGTGIHRLDPGQHGGGHLPGGQIPDRGGFRGRGDEHRGSRQGDRSGRAGRLPGGWWQPGDGRLPGTIPQAPGPTEAPGETPAPSGTSAPSLSPAP
jgi:hypothetical protein